MGNVLVLFFLKADASNLPWEACGPCDKGGRGPMGRFKGGEGSACEAPASGVVTRGLGPCEGICSFKVANEAKPDLPVQSV
ncbi:hypothetical protein P8452_39115 [Trifolium repens]|nr:hypothetical protein P8452_39115 [Trifolium repens]